MPELTFLTPIQIAQIAQLYELAMNCKCKCNYYQYISAKNNDKCISCQAANILNRMGTEVSALLREFYDAHGGFLAMMEG